MLKKPEHEVKIIGTRHGEKLYETLLTKEEKVLFTRIISAGPMLMLGENGVNMGDNVISKLS